MMHVIKVLEKKLSLAKNRQDRMMVSIESTDNLVSLIFGSYKNIRVKLPQSEVIKYLHKIHEIGLPKYKIIAISRILDMSFPQWKKYANPVVTGMLITRRSPEYYEWKKAVIKRDNKTCQECGSKKQVAAHHIYEYSKFPQLRVDIDNGICLCGKCHHMQHESMGYGMFVKN